MIRMNFESALRHKEEAFVKFKHLAAVIKYLICVMFTLSHPFLHFIISLSFSITLFYHFHNHFTWIHCKNALDASIHRIYNKYRYIFGEVVK